MNSYFDNIFSRMGLLSINESLQHGTHSVHYPFCYPFMHVFFGGTRIRICRTDQVCILVHGRCTVIEGKGLNL